SIAQSIAELLHRRGDAWITSPLPLHPTEPLRFSCWAVSGHAVTAQLGAMGYCCRYVGCGEQPRPAIKTDVLKRDGMVQQRHHAGMISCVEFCVDLPCSEPQSGNELAAKHDHRKRRLIETDDVMATMERQR